MRRRRNDSSQTQIALGQGRIVRLSDIATVKDSDPEQRTLAKLAGRQVISFNVQRSKGASDVTVYDEIWKELHKIENEDPRIHFAEIENQVQYTKEQYTSAMEGLIEGAILAVFVVFRFLRDIRATAISALAIPLSAIPSFWFMGLLDINLNGLSLLALSLVAGVLVDDAIVEIENIVRHMRNGQIRLPGVSRRRGRDRPGGARNDDVDRRCLPAGCARCRDFPDNSSRRSASRS